MAKNLRTSEGILQVVNVYQTGTLNCDFGLPSLCKRDLRSSAILCGVKLYFLSDVSGGFLRGSSLTLEDGTDHFSETSAINYHSTLRRIPKERSCQVL
jgi:hypothetical protein